MNSWNFWSTTPAAPSAKSPPCSRKASTKWKKPSRGGDDTVRASIEVNLTPEREGGFDAIAERIYRFEEVRTVYLMSGSFDLLVIIEGKSLQDVANFVATRLSTIEGVTQTRSHFMLKAYKKDGTIIDDKEKDRRLVVSP